MATGGGNIAGPSTRASTLLLPQHTILFRQSKRGRKILGYQRLHSNLPLYRYLLRMFYESPEDFSCHIRHFAGAVIMEVKTEVHRGDRAD